MNLSSWDEQRQEWIPLSVEKESIAMKQIERGYSGLGCERCGELLEYGGKGRKPKYCSKCTKHK